MGLEWHNRRRNPDGTFRSEWAMAMNPQEHPVQMHIRLPFDTWSKARNLANKQHQELTAYVTEALISRMRADQRRLDV